MLMKKIVRIVDFASPRVLSLLLILSQVINMNVGIIGGTLDALLLALHYRKHATVSVFEIDAELGLPITHPGRILNPSILNEYFTPEQIEFLKLAENLDGWGCRWEWIMKHMTTVTASEGVDIYPRTRVLSMERNREQILLTTTKNERNQPDSFIFDLVISTSPTSQKPGRLQHNIDESLVLSYTNQDSVPWFGGTLLTLHHPFSSMPKPELTLSRSDGQTEVWWKGACPWTPPTGYLETCSGKLHPSADELSFDATIERVNGFIDSLP